ncbi:MAG TPA: AMIN domain-containing protein [Candidatus Sulfotelmatobacter sp.]|nr:AMIN domain-containing protein [Candidatus Sulfotelmatobacter sp.]
MRRSSFQFACVTLMALTLPVRSASQSSAPAPLVNSVRIVHEHGTPALEILSTHPVVPAIQTLDSPARLVVDLPNARLGPVKKRISVNEGGIASIRTEQYRHQPPVTRIVVDLSAPYGYSWDAAGNRLMIRLKPAEDANAAKNSAMPPSLPTLATASVPAVVPVSGGDGSMVLAGSRIGAGSSVTAGAETAILALSRGGEIRVCPRTTVSVTPSKSKHELMLGMGSGALEAHYALDAAADSVLTPDFRILFAGPGQFHYAISADSHGNTCVRALMGNTASAIVSELMGDRIYQVKPNEQVVFHSGQIDKVDANVPLECGCPPPVPPVMPADTVLANTPAATAAPESDLPEKANLSNPSAQPGRERAPAAGDAPGTQPSPATMPSHGSETDPLPPPQPGEVHIQVDAPFVFSGRNRGMGPPPAILQEIAALPLEDSSRQMSLETIVQPPLARDTEPRVKHPFLHRLSRFFAAIFS